MNSPSENEWFDIFFDLNDWKNIETICSMLSSRSSISSSLGFWYPICLMFEKNTFSFVQLICHIRKIKWFIQWKLFVLILYWMGTAKATSFWQLWDLKWMGWVENCGIYTRLNSSQRLGPLRWITFEDNKTIDPLERINGFSISSNCDG